MSTLSTMSDSMMFSLMGTALIIVIGLVGGVMICLAGLAKFAFEALIVFITAVIVRGAWIIFILVFNRYTFIIAILVLLARKFL